MMEQATLIKNVLEKCRTQKWYGGDKTNTARFTEKGLRYETNYTPDGTEITIDHDPDDHIRKTTFAYKTATEEQLLATEQALGSSLPLFLRMIYSQIANGGFGPGYGLHGALGGFDEAGNIVDGYNFHFKHCRLIEQKDFLHSAINEPIDLPETAWPRYLLYLCDWDYATTSCLDAITERVYLCSPSSTIRGHYTLLLEASSLENWFESWLTGNLEDKGEYVANLTMQEEGKMEVVPLYMSDSSDIME